MDRSMAGRFCEECWHGSSSNVAGELCHGYYLNENRRHKIGWVRRRTGIGVPLPGLLSMPKQCQKPLQQPRSQWGCQANPTNKYLWLAVLHVGVDESFWLVTSFSRTRSLSTRTAQDTPTHPLRTPRKATRSMLILGTSPLARPLLFIKPYR